MPRNIAVSTLNASSVDIINTIRANASAEYQQYVPEIKKATEIPKVGEIIFGYPALANQFISSLMNRIAAVVVKSATFNNMYADLKKGYLEFGETVEEVFVELAKAREFSAEKAESREFKRTIPDVKTAFHCMNYRVQYPITIQYNDLQTAFTSADGVKDLVDRIMNSVYTAAEYDEFLLFKYLLIKAFAHGHMKVENITIPSGGELDMNQAAVTFRALSNKMTFISTAYNSYGVHTNTPKKDQYIFMDADFNAQYDVNVLAAAFNMDKAEFTGHLKLIDDWGSFDNDRFSDIIAGSDQIEEVNLNELDVLNTSGIKAVILDKEWFQIYDNLTQMTEVFVSSGMYWNYNYNVWKTVSYSPFSNAVAITASETGVSAPRSISFKITSIDNDKNNGVKVYTLTPSEVDIASFVEPKLVQTEALTKLGVAVQEYGAIMVPSSAESKVTVEMLTATNNGKTYAYNSTNPASSTSTTLLNTLAVGTQIIFK